jgi:hypothetical protein
MNNEPVAWISVLGIDKIGQKFTDVRISLTKTDVADIPLYTHPAKTLTDEEIEEVYRTVEQDFALTESKKPNGGWRNFPVELAKAILRKAQEK